MPTVYRSMVADEDKPQIGRSARTLGVRVVPDPHVDISIDPGGNVHPGTGGMSVAPAWQRLPVHRIPRRLKGKVPGAAGNDNLICWRLGEGPFVAGALTPDLSLRPDPNQADDHGFVEPARAMTFTDYDSALAATRVHWVRDEN